jgi:hypothetical protein
MRYESKMTTREEDLLRQVWNEWMIDNYECLPTAMPLKKIGPVAGATQVSAPPPLPTGARRAKGEASPAAQGQLEIRTSQLSFARKGQKRCTFGPC